MEKKMEDTLNPELKKVFDDLMADVRQLIDKFLKNTEKGAEKAVKQTQQAQSMGGIGTGNTTANVQKLKSLPWFQHGVKGFLNKLWWGDHPENPMWNKFQKESVSYHKRLTLHEYNIVKKEIKFFAEQAGFNIGSVLVVSLLCNDT